MIVSLPMDGHQIRHSSSEHRADVSYTTVLARVRVHTSRIFHGPFMLCCIVPNSHFKCCALKSVDNSYPQELPPPGDVAQVSNTVVQYSNPDAVGEKASSLPDAVGKRCYSWAVEKEEKGCGTSRLVFSVTCTRVKRQGKQKA